MTTAAIRKKNATEFALRYREALCRHLEQTGKDKSTPAAKLDRDVAAANLYLEQTSKDKSTPAKELGRDAVALGLKTLALATLHEKAVMLQVISGMPVAERNRLLRRAGNFFAEVLVPIEATQHEAMQRAAKLLQLNEKLDQRTQTLFISNKNLKKEIAKRKVVENSLRVSRQRSNKLLDQSRLLQKELRNLSYRILSSQEDERKRISRELHDLVAQTLSGINVHLAALKAEAALNTKGITKNIERTQKLVEKSVDVVHLFARELRPALLDDLGLIPALHSFVKDFAKETGLRVNLTAFSGVEKMNDAKRTVLYRVALEALSNAARHAHASLITVDIKQVKKFVSMQIKDDGQAFDVKSLMHNGKNKRMGLLGMRERVEMVGGTFTIESSPGAGTSITAQIPFRNAVEEHTKP